MNIYAKCASALVKAVISSRSGGVGAMRKYLDECSAEKMKPSASVATSTAQRRTEPSAPYKLPQVSNKETIDYQKREIGKELLILEKHLQQGCKINQVACECCQKHPLAIEALAEETLGMTAEPVYSELKDWTKGLGPKVTTEASSSGKYDDEYPRMAVKAREFRKKILGTTDFSAVLSPETRKTVEKNIGEIAKALEGNPGNPDTGNPIVKEPWQMTKGEFGRLDIEQSLEHANKRVGNPVKKPFDLITELEEKTAVQRWAEQGKMLDEAETRASELRAEAIARGLGTKESLKGVPIGKLLKLLRESPKAEV